MTKRYEHVLAGDKWMILDRRTGDAIGYLHNGYVAAQVVRELNNMGEKARG